MTYWQEDSPPRCRVCGCTWEEPCDPPCSWVGNEDICSGCVTALRFMVKWAEGAHRANLTALLREFRRLTRSVHSRLTRKLVEETWAKRSKAWQRGA